MMSVIDLSKLEALVTAGYLSCRKHPTDALLIWNYTQKTQWERNWTAETRMCRGLITTPGGVVIARPFEKFYNAGEWVAMGNEIPVEPFEVTEKLDGSLGILYRSSRGPAIATRGSFESPQAQMGTRLLAPLLTMWRPAPDLTYLFEIIYPENRIVVNYGDRRGLTLLAVIETATGQELPLSYFPELPSARRYEVTEFDAIMAMGSSNEEGFVVRFESGLRLKIKLDEYIRLHKLLTGVTPRKIWEVLSAGQSLHDFASGAPEEFRAWLIKTARDLIIQHDLIQRMCADDLARVPRDVSRKEQAAIIKTMRYPAMLFRALDDQSYESLIWKAIYPPATSAFRDQPESVA
jgi:RNA ligase